MCEAKSLFCDKNPSVAIGIMINIFTFLHFGPLDQNIYFIASSFHLSLGNFILFFHY